MKCKIPLYRIACEVFWMHYFSNIWTSLSLVIYTADMHCGTICDSLLVLIVMYQFYRIRWSECMTTTTWQQLLCNAAALVQLTNKCFVLNSTIFCINTSDGMAFVRTKQNCAEQSRKTIVLTFNITWPCMS